MVRMNIQIAAHARGAITTLAWQPLMLDYLTFGFYRRVGEVPEFGFNDFSTDPEWTWTKRDGKRLVIQLAASGNTPEFDVDMVWDEQKGTWTGSFERNTFAQRVVLRRPAFAGKASPFVGTWRDTETWRMNNCVHIAQQADGS